MFVDLYQSKDSEDILYSEIFDRSKHLTSFEIEDTQDLKDGFIQFIMKMRLIFGSQEIECGWDKIRGKNIKDLGLLEQVKYYNEIIWPPFEREIRSSLCYDSFYYIIDKEIKSGKYNSVFIEAKAKYDVLEVNERIQVSYWSGSFIQDVIISSIDYKFNIKNEV